MIYALQATARFTTPTARDATKDDLVVEVADKPRWGSTEVVPGDDGGTATLAISTRFPTQGERDAVYARLVDKTGNEGGLGVLHHHVCTHDEENPTPCTITVQVALTVRLLVVIRQAFLTQANTAATVLGQRAFNTPLRLRGDATNTIRAYGAMWGMTPPQLTSFRTRLREQGLLDGEVVVVTKADQATFVPNLQARAYLFDGREGGWTSNEVLNVLNLDRLE